MLIELFRQLYRLGLVKNRKKGFCLSKAALCALVKNKQIAPRIKLTSTKNRPRQRHGIFLSASVFGPPTSSIVGCDL